MIATLMYLMESLFVFICIFLWTKTVELFSSKYLLVICISSVLRIMFSLYSHLLIKVLNGYLIFRVLCRLHVLIAFRCIVNKGLFLFFYHY